MSTIKNATARTKLAKKTLRWAGVEMLFAGSVNPNFTTIRVPVEKAGYAISVLVQAFAGQSHIDVTSSRSSPETVDIYVTDHNQEKPDD